MEKAVVTGIGLVTPLGFGREKSWQEVLAGSSAVKPDPEDPGMLSARVEGLAVPGPVRLLSMAFLAAAEAVQDSGLRLTQHDAARIGCTVSVSKPNLAALDAAGVLTDAFQPSALGTQLARVFGVQGPIRNIAAACATGKDSIIIAAEMVMAGECDIALAGAAESSFHPLYRAGFKRMGVLAREAARPFDRRRDGFAMGEGCGIIIVESRRHAMMRGARVYGEIAGWSMSCDTGDPLVFRRDGEGIAAALRQAAGRANFPRIDYINAHGTGTVLNDAIETRAVKRAFGEAARGISLSSTKAATGHLLGASGAVELAFCLLAMRDGAVPPTLNLREPDPECDLDYTPDRMKTRPVQAAASLSFGFGGQIGAVIVTK